MSDNVDMNKLGTYIHVVLNQNVWFEKYTEEIYDTAIRKSIYSLRISTHELRFERRRYFGEKRKKDCVICNGVEKLKMKRTSYVYI